MAVQLPRGFVVSAWVWTVLTLACSKPDADESSRAADPTDPAAGISDADAAGASDDVNDVDDTSIDAMGSPAATNGETAEQSAPGADDSSATSDLTIDASSDVPVAVDASSGVSGVNESTAVDGSSASDAGALPISAGQDAGSATLDAAVNIASLDVECDSTALSESDEYGLAALRQQLAQSWRSWHALASERYRFVASRLVPEYPACSTSFEVQNGAVTRRSQSERDAADGPGPAYAVFDETADAVGSNAGCLPSLQVEDLYVECAREVLCSDLLPSEIRFTRHPNGVLRDCYATDGSSRGLSLGALAFDGSCPGGELLASSWDCIDPAVYCYPLREGGYCTGPGELPYACPDGYELADLCLNCGGGGGCGNQRNTCAIQCQDSAECDTACDEGVCQGVSGCF